MRKRGHLEKPLAHDGVLVVGQLHLVLPLVALVTRLTIET